MQVGDRLKYARERVGLSGSQVNERTQIGESSLSEFENGKREPSLSQLNKLANLYRRSIAYFLEEGPLSADPSVLWRERPSENSADIENQFLQYCEQYRNLEIWCNEIIPSALPFARSNPAFFLYPQAKQLAKDVRDKLQLGDRPGQSLLRILEEVCAVKVFHLPFKPTGAAASTKSESLGCAVLLNSNNKRWRRNFDLAHELFHLLTWDLFGHGCSETSSVASEFEEQLANVFARNVLMPEEILRLTVEKYQNAKGDLPLDAFFNIARQFDVSAEALMWQIHNLYRKPTDADKTKNEIEKLKTYALTFKENEREKPPKWPTRYRMLAIKAYQKGEVSTGRLAEYLGISRQEAMRFNEQEIGESEEIQITPA